MDFSEILSFKEYTSSGVPLKLRKLKHEKFQNALNGFWGRVEKDKIGQSLDF